MQKREDLGVVEESSQSSSSGAAAKRDKRVSRLAALGRALSEPVRVEMIGMMAEGRGCCGLSEVEGERGICVCEFQRRFGIGQSKVSYHLAKLKEAGLIEEEKRGRWHYYALEREEVANLLGEVADHLLLAAPQEANRAEYH